MIEFLGIFFLALAACAGVASAINFFWQTGLAKAFGHAAFVTGIFLLFWGLGPWEGASRHSWGKLAPLFALMLVLGWAGVYLATRLFVSWLKKRGQKR